MSEITTLIGPKTYTLACETGQEERLTQAADRIHTYAKILLDQFKSMPEEQLLLMSALMIADDLLEADIRIKKLQQASDNTEKNTELDALVVELLETATSRIHNITRKITTS